MYCAKLDRKNWLDACNDFVVFWVYVICNGFVKSFDFLGILRFMKRLYRF